MGKRRFDYSPPRSSTSKTPLPVLVPYKKPKIIYEDLPPINNISDLIAIGNNMKFYKNINMKILWNIIKNLTELNNMIGLKSLKETMFLQILYYIQNMHKIDDSEEYLHCIITGAQGTGKTTVAKIIGNIYKDLGILSKKSTFTIAYREDFVGEYLGHSAIKTRNLLESCLGGCLFVDELYALGCGGSNKDSFSKEAIDTINAFLSEHKKDFVFIGAGYSDDIEKCFFSVNKGLKRRFQWHHKIDTYSNEELADIFLKMVRSGSWKIEFEKQDVVDLITLNKDNFKDNGGSCESLFSKGKLAHSKRVFGQDESIKFKLTKEDLIESVKLMKKYDNTAQEKKDFYNMYT